MLLESLAAIGLAHFLPGLLLVKVLDLGRSREERWVVGAVLGGPVSALVYLLSLITGSPAIYWSLAGLLALAGLLLPFRSRRGLAWPRRSRIALGGLLAAVLLPYLLTTGHLYRVDAQGTLLLDQALQRDALFHIGIVRSLETAYPPKLLSISGAPVGYHVGYHLQLALWSRFYGVDPMDGLVRLGAIFSIGTYLLSAYVLASRLLESERARLLATVLAFGSGLGFLVCFRPSVDWWSLAFMDWALVSIFLANPLLPALPLLFLGLSLLHDYTQASERGSLAAAVFALGFVFSVKMFVGAQMLAALGLAALLRPRDRRSWVAVGSLALAASPILAHTLVAAAGSNTAIGLRPLEIVRYSMEKLDWSAAVSALANAGRFETSTGGFVIVLAAVFLWLAGFLGLRVLGLGSVFRGLRASSLLERSMALFVLLGFPLSLLLRIAPAESEGLSRLESVNDAAWFVTQGGVVLWFFTARGLSRRPSLLTLVAAVVLALPSTVQHFFHAASLEPDRIGASRVEAARRAASLSVPSDVWVEPPDRVRPSLLAYVSGRPVVYDSYVGYDYMFVGRDEIDYRRHAVALFWSSEDPGYLAWFLDRFDVGFVWREGRELPAPIRPWLERDFENHDVELLRVRRNTISEALEIPIALPESIPLGGRAQAYFGPGWRRRADHRVLHPGDAKLYLPLERDVSATLTLELSTPSRGGELFVEGRSFSLSPEMKRVVVELPPRGERGLHVITLDWRSSAELAVVGIRAATRAR